MASDDNFAAESVDTDTDPNLPSTDGNGNGAQLACDVLGVSPSTTPAPRPAYHASVYPGPEYPLPDEFAEAVIALESVLGMPIWLLVQQGRPNSEPYSDISYHVYKGIVNQCNEIEHGKPVAMLIESPGGSAHYAYSIVRLFQRRANRFVVLVPQYAKSAATLMALGAQELIMGQDAQLGPLDVQMLDRDREEYGSALDAVQALERLNAFAMTAVDQTMPLLIARTGKKTDAILPHVLGYVTDFVKPLLDKVDTIDFTKKSRELKVAEEYAVRLMTPTYSLTAAKRIARKLVENYPTHGFVIDRDEAALKPVDTDGPGLGMKITKASEEVESILRKLSPYIDNLTAVGRIKETQT